jgi:hypothetical protein
VDRRRGYGEASALADLRAAPLLLFYKIFVSARIPCAECVRLLAGVHICCAGEDRVEDAVWKSTEHCKVHV